MGERAVFDDAIHATAVAIGDHAVLLLGPSRSGKSRLAAALIAASEARRPIALVADDRVLLRATADGLEARPHPRIAGFIERRGLGIVATAWRPRARVAGVVLLGEPANGAAKWDERYPALSLADIDPSDRAQAVIAWWCGRAQPCDAKGSAPVRCVGQD